MTDLTVVPPEQTELTPVAPAALEVMERARQDTGFATAKKWPRPEPEIFRKRTLSLATIDTETAESCMFTLKRRDSDTGEMKLIQGQSIRFAEIAACTYQNIYAGARVVANDGRKVTAQGICIDLENNVTMFAEVSRRITTREGRAYSEDMQIVTAQAACAIARRNAIFQVIPFAMLKPVYEQVKQVVTGNVSTLAVKRDKVFKRFYSMGVNQDKILRVLGKENAESVDLEDIALLVGLGTAVKDKELTIEQAFATEEDEDETPRSPLRERLAARRAQRHPEKENE